jgi:predicted Zn-dependent protease
MQRGIGYVFLEEYEQAHTVFEESLEIAERLPDDTQSGGDQTDVLSLEWLGTVAAKQEHFEEAEGWFRQALARREARFGESPHLGEALLPLRDVLVRREGRDEALALHERWITILSRRQDPERAIAHAHASLAKAFVEAEEFREALDFYEISLETRPPKRNRMDVATRLEDYAGALEAGGLEERAESVRAQRAELVDGTDYVEQVLHGRDFSEIVARWRADQMPLRVRIMKPSSSKVRDPDAAVALAREAVLAWNDTVAPGLPTFEFTTWSGDITIRWSHDQRGNGYLGLCQPWVRYSDRPLSRASIRVYSQVLDVHLSDDQLRHIIIHEVGHALGLLGHSPLRDDVMFAVVAEELIESPSDRDLATLRKLYGQKAGESFKWSAPPEVESSRPDPARHLRAAGAP